MRGWDDLPPASADLQELTDPELADDPDAQVQHLAALTEQASWREPSPWFIELAERMGLSPFESALLLLCVGVELEAVISELCARLQPGGSCRNPTFALALALFDDAGLAAFAPGAPLRRWRLIEINQPGAQPLIVSPIRADERVVNYALGLEPFDDRLGAWVRRMDLPEPLQRLPRSHLAVLDVIKNHLRQAGQPSSMPLIQLIGPDATSKQAIACRAAALVGFELDRIAAEDLPTHPGELETLGLLWRRECRLHPRALYLDAEDLDASRPSEAAAHPVARLLGGSSGLIFLAAREPWTRAGRPSLVLDVDKPTAGEQRERWARELGDEAGATRPSWPASSTSTRRRSWPRSGTPGAAASAANATSGAGSGTTAGRPSVPGSTASPPPADEGDAATTWSSRPRRSGCSARSSTRCVTATAVYEDWGFGGKMSRGLGLSVLFAGESGTGKTMAAEVLASAAPPRPLPDRPLGRRQQVHRRDREEPPPACSTPPRTAARSSSSTRPTPSSASGARSRTATTATPTSRSTTCCSGWRRTGAWRSWRRT